MRSHLPIEKFILILASIIALSAYGCLQDQNSSHNQCDPSDGCAGINGEKWVTITGEDGSATEFTMNPKEYSLVTLNGKTPDGKPATFHVDNSAWTIDYNNVTEFSMTTDVIAWNNDESMNGNDLYVSIERQNYIFVPWSIHALGDKSHPTVPVVYEHEWSDGTYALDGTGNFESTDGKIKKTFKTIVENGKIFVEGASADYHHAPMITYNKWFYEDDDELVNGNISDDLSTIIFSMKGKKTGKEISGTVMRK